MAKCNQLTHLPNVCVKDKYCQQFMCGCIKNLKSKKYATKSLGMSHFFTGINCSQSTVHAFYTINAIFILSVYNLLFLNCKV